MTYEEGMDVNAKSNLDIAAAAKEQAVCCERTAVSQERQAAAMERIANDFYALVQFIMKTIQEAKDEE